jgi:hypothetical protein
MRELALKLGLTERTLYTIIKDLAAVDMVRVGRLGRQNTYSVDPAARLVQPLFSHLRLGSFLAALQAPTDVAPDLHEAEHVMQAVDDSRRGSHP